MFDVFKQFATDPTAEEKGRPFTSEFGGGVTLHLARINNRSYQSQIQAEYKANEHTLKRGQVEGASEADKQMAEALSFKLVGRVLARTVLLGWDLNEAQPDGTIKVTQNAIGYKGQILPYSIDNAELLLSHKEFRDRVVAVAGNYEKFLIEQEEADAKNSVTTSTGISSGEPVSNTSNE